MLVLTEFSFWDKDCALGYDSFFYCCWYSLISKVLSLSATREATCMYHVYYKQSSFISLAVKGKFGKTSKSLLSKWDHLRDHLLCSWKITYSFYVFANVQNQHIAVGVLCKICVVRKIRSSLNYNGHSNLNHNLGSEKSDESPSRILLNNFQSKFST